jgi:membrane-associated phospholipid phosphatase
MANIYSNDLKEILNSTVINRNIDCSIPCNILLYFMCCCPTQVINYFPPGSKDFKEMFMILLSLTPYPTVFILICLAAYFRTSRSVLILVMVFLENFTVIALKNFIREPRPNYLCNQEFGYPSNHACFFTCILFWFISEELCTPEHLQFEYKTYLIPFGLIYPFIVYSRYYLNYHSMKQVINGIIFGFLFSIFWYFFSVKYILKYDNPLKQIFNQLNVINTLTDDNISSFNFTDNTDNNIKNKELIQKYKELLENKDIEKIRNNLNKIAQNIKNDDFMKQQKKMMNLEDNND